MPLTLLTLLAAIVAATGYLFSRTWMPVLASSAGGAIDRQLTLNLILLGIVFCATQLALGLFVWKYRGRDGGGNVEHVGQPSARTELAWLTLAAALFLGLNIAGAVFWPQNSSPLTLDEKTIRVEVTGVQFRWYFRLPGADKKFGTTKPELVDASEGNPLGMDRADPASTDDLVSSELVVPVDREVELTLRAQDVIHSFFVPALRVKQDAVPGQAIIIHIHPTQPGTYDIACAQLCGMGHYQMNAKLKVAPEDEYRAWLSGNSPYRQQQAIRVGHPISAAKR